MVVDGERSGAKYRNRLFEALTAISKYNNGLENNFKKRAYVNLYPIKGSDSKSSEYKKLLSTKYKDDFNARVEDIIQKYPPKIIITCSDIFDSLLKEALKTGGNNIKALNGIKYENEKMYAFEYNNIKYYEIKHPSRSSKIEA